MDSVDQRAHRSAVQRAWRGTPWRERKGNSAGGMGSALRCWDECLGVRQHECALHYGCKGSAVAGSVDGGIDHPTARDADVHAVRAQAGPGAQQCSRKVSEVGVPEVSLVHAYAWVEHAYDFSSGEADPQRAKGGEALAASLYSGPAAV